MKYAAASTAASSLPVVQLAGLAGSAGAVGVGDGLAVGWDDVATGVVHDGPGAGWPPVHALTDTTVPTRTATHRAARGIH
ncbi:MAG: hypothetical protein KQH57_09630 [Actinomycetales bacterium]|nr:hypothetical protein [Actinomycetales bacterium]